MQSFTFEKDKIRISIKEHIFSLTEKQKGKGLILSREETTDHKNLR